MALRAHAPRAGPDVLTPAVRPASVLVALTAAVVAAGAVASCVGAAGGARLPEPVVVAAPPFPPPVPASFARPAPPLLEALSDVGHPVRADFATPSPVPAWVPRAVGAGALRRLIPQGTLAFALYGEDFASERYVVGLDLRRRAVRYVLDLGALNRTPAATPEEREFTHAGVTWVREADGVLFVSSSHSTYASSSKGRNAAITAIDLRTSTVRWRSPSLVANAGTFVLAPGRRIVSGYGFTDEPDFVYVLDRSTGRVLDRLPVRDGPESITRRGSELRVETYSRSLVLRLR